MKKILTIIVCAATILMTFAGCAKKEPNIVFTGTIDDVSDKSILVTTTDQVDFDKASVSYAPDLKLSFDPTVGQVVKITIKPEIRESYPVQVTAVAIELVSAPASPDPEHADYTASFFRADSKADGGRDFIASIAENAETAAISSVRHIPVILLEDDQALSDFIAEGSAYFQLNTAYGENVSFQKNAERYDETFFKNNKLLLLCAEETSGSIRHEIEDVAIKGSALSVAVKAIAPETGTDDMADWFIILELPNDEIAGCTSYDAYYAK